MRAARVGHAAMVPVDRRTDRTIIGPYVITCGKNQEIYLDQNGSFTISIITFNISISMVLIISITITNNGLYVYLFIIIVMIHLLALGDRAQGLPVWLCPRSSALPSLSDEASNHTIIIMIVNSSSCSSSSSSNM